MNHPQSYFVSSGQHTLEAVIAVPNNWYYAVDTYHGKAIEDDVIIDLLDTLPSNKTGRHIGALPLVLGMPVVITENFNVAGGIVNGSTGILCKV